MSFKNKKSFVLDKGSLVETPMKFFFTLGISMYEGVGEDLC